VTAKTLGLTVSVVTPWFLPLQNAKNTKKHKKQKNTYANKNNIIQY